MATPANATKTAAPGPGQPYQGVVVPMVSPFTPAGEIDEPAVGRIVERLVANRIAGVFPLGTTGESSSISTPDRRKLVAATARAVAGRATVYAGVSGNCYKEAVEASLAYRDAGVTAVVAHVPSYYALSDAEIEDYYKRLADTVALPLVLYNIPVTTHHSIPLDAVDRLREHGNVVALKESAGDPARIKYFQRTGGRGGFPVLLGSSTMYAHGLKAGAVGLIPSGAHLIPEMYQAMYEAGMARDWARVDELQRQTESVTARYLKGRSLGQGLSALKALMEAEGLCGRTMLPPLPTYVGSVESLTAGAGKSNY